MPRKLRGERYEREWRGRRVLARLAVDQVVRFWLFSD
jgi:hypothetical protein